MPYIATEKWPPKLLFGGRHYSPGDPVPAEHARTADSLVSRGYLKEVAGPPTPPSNTSTGEGQAGRQRKAVEARATKVRAILTDAGYDTPQKIADASDEELVALKGIGKATVKQIRSGELEV